LTISNLNSKPTNAPARGLAFRRSAASRVVVDPGSATNGRGFVSFRGKMPRLFF
jgi:hypothetical protein